MGCASSKAGADSPQEYQFYSQYKLGKKLGEGAFGQVRLVTDRETQKDYAVKIVDVRERNDDGSCSGTVSKSRDKVTKAEVKLWEKVSATPCEFTVYLHKTFFEKSLYYMVCEKCACSFMDKLVDSDTMTERDLSKIFRQMLLGIGHTHGCGIVHRDIKPDNFLWGGPDNQVLKLCDFGLAAEMPKSGLLTGVFGTAPYMAPEMLKSEGYDQSSDMWSVGAVAYLLVYGNFPYSPREASAPAMKQAIMGDKPALTFPDEKSAQGVVSGSLSGAIEFTRALLNRNAKARPKALEALKLSFIEEVPKKAEVAVEAEKAAAKDSGEMRQRKRRARTLTQQVKMTRPDATVQNGIDSLLKKLVTKNGGEAASGSGLWFSEGDKDKDEEEEETAPTTPQADARVTKKSSRRDVKHSTHSGVLSEGFKATLSELSSPRLKGEAARI
eukprot:TRINITY_DN63927_c0_g1_i1.p1 TRINITY_DN63927_c0_g1~~TRINITY_DN63927_c0_g1_i1.p1  ORF type:complete len:440 (-),score=72.58 TRINITY_DN63927_c0_g1_i1:153-1472(-)